MTITMPQRIALPDEAATVAELRELLKRAKHVAIRVHYSVEHDCNYNHFRILKEHIEIALKYKPNNERVSATLDPDGWLWIGA